MCEPTPGHSSFKVVFIPKTAMRLIIIEKSDMFVLNVRDYAWTWLDPR